jgi:deoxyribonuclease-4
VNKKKELLLGAHMSIAGGFDLAISRGESIGCTCIQLFTKSNRQWYAKPLVAEEVKKFKEAAEQSSIPTKLIAVHASYLINLASSNPETHRKSLAAAIEELERCETLGIPWLILHPGAAQDAEEGLKRVAESFNIIFEKVPGKTKILLETMAGQGSVLCHTFEQIAQIYEQVSDKKRLGVCLDTCHIFAAGYDIRTKEGYEAMWEQFDKIIGRDLLQVIHCNDSKKALGSRVDRHADIGEGELGLEPFRLLFNDPRLSEIPKILETPKETLHDDKRNMDIILGLID